MMRARDVLLTAYDKSPIGRMIIYRLAEVAVRTKSFDEAKEYYQEFVEIAPHDNLKYVLKYEISKAQGADIGTLYWHFRRTQRAGVFRRVGI